METQALIEAAKEGNLEAARQAIAVGADVSVQSSWGGTALDWVAKTPEMLAVIKRASARRKARRKTRTRS